MVMSSSPALTLPPAPTQAALVWGPKGQIFLYRGAGVNPTHAPPETAARFARKRAAGKRLVEEEMPYLMVISSSPALTDPPSLIST